MKVFRCIAALVVLAASQCKNPAPSHTGSKEPSKTKAYNFPEYADWLNTGKGYKMADFRGHFVLLDFWTYGCINCQHVIPDLAMLEHEFPSLVVIGVHSAKFTGEQNSDNIRKAIDRYGIKHPVLNDFKFEMWNAYGVRAWPTFVLIDPDGYVAGMFSGEGFVAKLKPLLTQEIETFTRQKKHTASPFVFAPEDSLKPRSVLSFPSKIEADPAGNRLFLTDAGNHRIVILKPDGEIMDVIGSGLQGQADGDFAQATLNKPGGVALDAATGMLYIADAGNHLIRVADLKQRKLKTVLGDGQKGNRQGQVVGINGSLNSPEDLCLQGHTLFIAMAGLHQVWRMDISTKAAAPYAGNGAEALKDGTLSKAAFAQPSALALLGSKLLVADPESSALRELNENWVETLVGKGLFDYGDADGKSDSAKLQHLQGLSIQAGKVYIADTYNHRIKEYNPATRMVKSIVGAGQAGFADGSASISKLYEPADMAWLGGKLYIADAGNSLIRVFTPASGKVSTLVPTKIKALRKAVSARVAPEATKGNDFVLSPDVQELQLSFTLSNGYEFNKEAPNFIDLFANDKGVVKVDGFRFVDGVYSYRVPVRLSPGNGSLRISAEIYYCDYKHGGMCYVEQVNADYSIQVKPGGGDRFVINRLIK